MEAPNFLIGAGHGTSLLEGRKAGVTSQLDTGLTGDFFDHIDDLLDFSNEEIAGPIGDNGTNWPKNENDICPDNSLTETASCNLLVDGHNTGELYVPCDDLAELEWLSNFVEDSFSTENGPKPLFSPDFGTGMDDPDRKGQSSDKFRSSSPISVLESSSSSGKTSTFSPEMAVPGRARSKRSRAPACNWASSFLSPTSSDILLENGTNSSLSANAAFCTDSDYHIYEQEESQPTKKLHKTNQGMKKKGQEQIQVRRCMHCAMTKTPQWRTGPMGPKTLCNACGVRYKSGRLLPEYRPAASPTFSAVNHSNSHKKVLEMRRHKETGQREASKEEQSYFGSDDGYLLHTGQDYRHLI